MEAKLENGRIEIVVPDTDVYIINLYPPVESELPMDADTIQDREIDIKFHDRTKYDVRLAEVKTDYIELIEQLESLALKHSEDDEAFKRDYNDLLDNVTKSKTRIGMKPRVYRDLIQGRFDIHKVTYIERVDDGNTIFGKASEFSSKTANQLKEAGYQDAQDTIEFETLKDIISNLIDKEIITKVKGCFDATEPACC
jgi:NTE family protein